jgi:hypothetical protein
LLVGQVFELQADDFGADGVDVLEEEGDGGAVLW